MIICVLYLVINTQVSQDRGRPFNINWVKVSDGMRYEAPYRELEFAKFKTWKEAKSSNEIYYYMDIYGNIYV